MSSTLRQTGFRLPSWGRTQTPWRPLLRIPVADFALRPRPPKLNSDAQLSKPTSKFCSMRPAHEDSGKCLMPSTENFPDIVPIFIISFDRGEHLKRVIQSYTAQDIRVEIIIHDNGSTDPKTLQLLSELSAAGTRVYRADPIFQPDELNKVDASVRDFMKETGQDGPYVVTDCDIDLSCARADALRTYLELLEIFDDADCVGPMLRISDVPKSYPLFNRAMSRHIEQFWRHEPQWMTLRGARVAYLKAPIDTTFAVHRRRSAFRRHKQGVRVYHPFEARHLDWYLSSGHQTNYRVTSSPEISHWDNATEFSRYEAEPDAVLNYTVVEGELGDLRAVLKSTLDNPLGDTNRTRTIWERLRERIPIFGERRRSDLQMPRLFASPAVADYQPR